MFRAPRPAHLPHIESILNDLGQPVQAVAKHLDIDPSTLRRYRATGQAPRTVMLALFWETSWGRSQTDTEAINNARMLYQANMMLERRNAKLLKRIELLEKELVQGHAAANMPFFETG